MFKLLLLLQGELWGCGHVNWSAIKKGYELLTRRAVKYSLIQFLVPSSDLWWMMTSLNRATHVRAWAERVAYSEQATTMCALLGVKDFFCDAMFKNKNQPRWPTDNDWQSTPPFIAHGPLPTQAPAVPHRTATRQWWHTSNFQWHLREHITATNDRILGPNWSLPVISSALVGRRFPPAT